jgi:hypothetical protein
MNRSNPIQKLSEDLALAVTGEQVAAVLRSALSADTVQRDGSRGPDHKVRIEAARLLLAYTLGTPIQRSENVTVNLDADSMTGLRERLKASPAMRETLAGLLAEVDRASIDV